MNTPKVIITPMQRHINNGKTSEMEFGTNKAAYDYFATKCDALGYSYDENTTEAGGFGHDYRIELILV